MSRVVMRVTHLLCFLSTGMTLFLIYWQGYHVFSYLHNEKHVTRNRFRLASVYLAVAFEESGLGNMMFQYASLYGIARTTQRVALVYRGLPLRAYFQLSANTSLQERPGEGWGKLLELHASRYDEAVVKAAQQSADDLELVGYFQSWIYFSGAFDALRNEFRFGADVISGAQMFLRNNVFHISPGQGHSPANMALIGVHVRRGDMLFDKFREFGYTVADLGYIERAMRYFELQFTSSEITFLVVSNDIDWCLRNINITNRHVVFSRGNDAITDLALLSSCDHVIMTVGTFGWWGGWMAGGQVVYYNNFPRKGSKLEQAFSPTKYDYYPPDWIAL